MYLSGAWRIQHSIPVLGKSNKSELNKAVTYWISRNAVCGCLVSFEYKIGRLQFKIPMSYWRSWIMGYFSKLIRFLVILMTLCQIIMHMDWHTSTHKYINSRYLRNLCSVYIVCCCIIMSFVDIFTDVIQCVFMVRAWCKRLAPFGFSWHPFAWSSERVLGSVVK